MNHMALEPPDDFGLDSPSEQVQRTECWQKLRKRFEEIEAASATRQKVLYRLGAVRDVWDNLPLSLAMAGFALSVGWFSSLIGLPGIDLIVTLPWFFDNVLRVTATSAGAVLTGVFALSVCMSPRSQMFGVAAGLTTVWWCISLVYLILEGRWGVLCFAAPSIAISLWASYLWMRQNPEVEEAPDES